MRRDDRADAATIGTMITIVMVVGAAVGLFVWVSSGSQHTEDEAKMMSMNSGGPILSNVKTFMVSATARPMTWNELALLLDGVPMSYDGTSLNANHEWCVAQSGTTCVTGTTPPATMINGGDLLSIYHTSLAGKRLDLVDAGANQIVLSVALGS